jgi:N-acetylglucosamine-6-phosphate deacetylase
MNRPDLLAHHYATGQAVRVTKASGGGVELANAPAAPDDLWLAPALLDLQVNGYGGADFQQDDLTAKQFLQAADRLREAGCTRWFPTLITDEWACLMKRLRRLRALRARSASLKRAIAGWHVEGPFLSSKPGYHGAHAAKLMLDPSPTHIRQLRAAAGDDPVLLTLAPERPGALEAIALAVSLGIKVSLGHTNASAEILRAAVQAGASGFTHFANACPVTLDRHDNILWRVFDLPGLAISLIPDGHHVSPALFRLAHRAFRADSIHYVSDATAAAGAPPGRHALGKLTLEVGADQIVRRPGSRQFAGSALRPIDGVFRAAAMLGRPWQDVWRHFSTVPAQRMGLAAPEDWCLLRFDSATGTLADITVL